MSGMASFQEFPCRPQRCEGESLIGFIYRFLAVNGHRLGTGGYYPALRRLYADDMMRSLEVLKELSEVINESSYREDSFWEERASLLVDSTNPKALSFPKLRVQTVLLCAACMKEAPFHRALWLMPTVRSCPLHQTWLVNRCVRCGSPLQWTTLKADWKCNCGHTVYGAEVALATRRIVFRDQLLAVHPHFATEIVGKAFTRYRGDASLKDAYAAYCWTAAPHRLRDEWRAVRELNRDEKGRLRIRNLKRTIGFRPTLTFSFVRWRYFWWASMPIVGRNAVPPISILDYIESPRLLSRRSKDDFASTSAAKNRMRPKLAETLYAHRVIQLRQALVYFGHRVPVTVGLSALKQFNVWWAFFAADLRPDGASCKSLNRKKRRVVSNIQCKADRQYHFEITLIRLLDRLLFASCMNFGIQDLQRFWTGFSIPSSLPGSSRTPVYKRLTAYFMTCSLAELDQWIALIEADLEERHQEVCNGIA